MNKLKCTERYIQNGWGLTKVSAPKAGDKDSGKTPFPGKWTKNPIRTIEEARSCWEDGDLNIGIIMGEPSGIIVLDIDYPEEFEEFLSKHPECRDTYTVRRSNEDSGRCHYYFSIPEGMKYPKTRRVATTGWGDLLSTGTQVVAPPSVHYTGGIYEVVNDVEPLPFKEEYLNDLMLKKVEVQREAQVDHSAMEVLEAQPEDQDCKSLFPDLPDEIIARIEAGAPEGERNSTLFQLGCDLRDKGFDKEKAKEVALVFCKNCSPTYKAQNAVKTIDSVFNNNIRNGGKSTLKKLNYISKKVEDEDDEEVKYKLHPMDYDQVRDNLKGLCEDWIARLNGDVFVIPKEKGDNIRWLKNRTDFFGELGCEYNGVPDWKTGRGYMSRDEGYSALLSVLDEYEDIEEAPHYPLINGIFYNYKELPEPDYEVLEKLIGFFTPETEADRALLIALFATALWGGLPGQRVPFLITSKEGRGVGKSTLAEIAADILGQTAIQVSTKDKAEDIKTRLLSPDAMTKRVVIFDNESGNSRISNDQIASLFTTEQISGRALYKGEGSRANNMLWIITLNSPSLDSDFAVRCVPVSLKRPEYRTDWKESLKRFVDTNREVIQATLIDILKGDGDCSKPATRWGCWESNVLAKIPGIDLAEVQTLIRVRQREFDDEQFETDLIVDGIKTVIQKNDFSLTEDYVFITYNQMEAIVRDATGSKWTKTNILKKVNELIDKGDIHNLIDKRDGRWGLGFRWIGKDYTSGAMKPIQNC